MRWTGAMVVCPGLRSLHCDCRKNCQAPKKQKRPLNGGLDGPIRSDEVGIGEGILEHARLKLRSAFSSASAQAPKLAESLGTSLIPLHLLQLGGPDRERIVPLTRGGLTQADKRHDPNDVGERHSIRTPIC
jgi:hypothetical protein